MIYVNDSIKTVNFGRFQASIRTIKFALSIIEVSATKREHYIFVKIFQTRKTFVQFFQVSILFKHVLSSLILFGKSLEANLKCWTF